MPLPLAAAALPAATSILRSPFAQDLGKEVANGLGQGAAGKILDVAFSAVGQGDKGAQDQNKPVNF